MARIGRRRKTLLFFVALLVYSTIVGLLLRDRYSEFVAGLDVPNTTVHVAKPTPQDDPLALPPVVKEVPKEKDLSVPFLVQAPFGVWDELHGEACEEASLMMVKYFMNDEKFSSLQEADQEIKDLVSWQTKNGYKVDVTVSELARIARDYYSMNGARVMESPTVEEIKTEVASGRPVIVPAAGRLLGNPNFTAPGPPYHMLVIRGYNETEFVTNDPGTRRGEGYKYKFSTIMEAMHDWNGSVNNIEQGRKAVLVFDS
ncbi:MAG: C39 family peptidase [Candidatus Berkelbacteria bacterium]|nr:MAG: C39 family peptidase [Candidatus Berkelbacteria bacterium]QQG51878.1 MAG: C39 family peptidase [Candidatus Berkelbacteria bacterium]